MRNDKNQSSLNYTYSKLISLEASLATLKPHFGTGVQSMDTHMFII